MLLFLVTRSTDRWDIVTSSEEEEEEEEGRWEGGYEEGGDRYSNRTDQPKR